MKDPRVAAAASAGVLAALLLPFCLSAFAKEDPAAVKTAQDALRKKYKAEKKYVTEDFAYFIDVTKLKEQRWVFKEDIAPPTDPDQGLMMSRRFSRRPRPVPQSIKDRLLQVHPDGQRQTHRIQSRIQGDRQVREDGRPQGTLRGLLRRMDEELSGPGQAHVSVGGRRELGPTKFWACAVARTRKRRSACGWTGTCGRIRPRPGPSHGPARRRCRPRSSSMDEKNRQGRPAERGKLEELVRNLVEMPK